MLKLFLFIAFVADAVYIVSTDAVATATASTGGGTANATATSGTTTANANSGPYCSRPNEHLEHSPDPCSLQKCSQLGFPIDCPEATQDEWCPTKPACICNKGYVKNDKEICIPIKHCPCCGGDPNAEHGCGNCRTTCDDYYNRTEPYACAQYCLENGCDCRNGFVLDVDAQKCVRPEDCSNKCGPDENLDSCANGGYHDARTCKDLDTLNGTYICEDPDIKCKPGCLCKEGLLRNKHGKCIPENKCPNSKCKGDYETYVKCDINCLPKTCNELGFPKPCPFPLPGSSCPGKPACICRPGYVKDKSGKCIPEDECPSCGGDPYAKPGCGNHCGNRCSDYDKGPVPCPAFCIYNSCDCKEGYVYDDNIKKCVRPEHCTPTCGQNEEYTKCIEAGCVRKCSQIKPGQDVPIGCEKPNKCTPGCRCMDGYFKNSNGVCVSKDDCKYNGKCLGKPYEYWDPCSPPCTSETCAGIGKPADCPPQAAVCKPSCRCARGYYRNYKGVCVPEKQCKQCPKNEVFVDCVTTCPPRKCGYSNSVLCGPTNPDTCKEGCQCADDFYRNDKGECVKWEDCPKTCPKANEIWVQCPKPCDPNTCESIWQKPFCPAQPNYKCKGACKCKPGFYKNKIGECISKENCLKCTGPNEYYSCGGACDNVCSTLSQQNQTNCPIINIKCNEKCYCEKGYARDRDGICVPISSCRRCPGKHEWYDKCPPICPPGDGCDTYKKTYGCPAMIVNDTSHCKPACRCEDNYLRYNGTCIPEEQCPCNGDPNAKRDYCGCRITCTDYILKRKPNCTKCQINSYCVCRDGYVLEEKSGKCILPKDCPANPCPVGQKLGCGNNCNRKCSNYWNGTNPYACPKYACTLIGQSCQCDPDQGYYYDDCKKECVPFYLCPL